MTELWSCRPRGLQALLLAAAVACLVLAVMSRDLSAACGWLVVVTQTLSLALWRSTAEQNRQLVQEASSPRLWPAVDVDTISRACGYCGLTLAAPVMRDLTGPLRDATMDRVVALHWQRCPAAPLAVKT